MSAGGENRSVVVTGLAPPWIRDAIVDRLSHDGWRVVADVDPLPEAVVLLELDDAAFVERSFGETDEATWERLAEAPPRRTLAALQRVHAARRADGGVVVLVQPAIALEGAAGLVAATTGWEAQRQLAKSVARRWGHEKIRVTIVAAAPDLVAPPPTDALRTQRAIAPGDDLEVLAATVALVLRPDAVALTGSTIVADGGALMLP